MMIYLFSYILFFAVLLIAKKQNVNRFITEDGSLVNSLQLLLLHGAGIFLFGVLPFFFTHDGLPRFFNTTNLLTPPALLAIFLSAVVLLSAPRLATKTHKVAVFEQQEGSALAFSYFTTYFLLRTLFIVAYEIWFRGFLLADSIALLGVPTAITLNIGSYTLLHTVNGKQEMIGCIPFGLLLCALCIWQGAVWPAVVLHLALTLSYEITFLRKHKTLQHERISHRRLGLHRA